MGMKYTKLSGDLQLIEDLMKSSDKSEEFRRFQAVYLRISLNISVEDIAKITCFSESWVRQLHHCYKKSGIDGLKSKPKGGINNELFSKSQEVEFLSMIE